MDPRRISAWSMWPGLWGAVGRSVAGLSVAGLSVAGFLTPSPVAAQDLGACGDIQLQAEAQCEFVPPSLECQSECEPLAFAAACEAQLAVSCDGQCTAELAVGCDVSCNAQCSGDCELDPGQFSCQGQCEASCSADCSGSCAADGDSASCMGRCEAACSAGCDAECNVVPPSATCDVKCEAGCRGACEASANLDCNISCQADGFANCEAELTGGCMVACQGDKGALFCDGQYVDPRDDIKACVDALKAALNLNVEGYASAQGNCVGSQCSAEASAAISTDCSVAAPGRGAQHRGLAGLALLAVGACVVRRRR